VTAAPDDDDAARLQVDGLLARRVSSLNTGAKYSSPSGLGERQGLEHGLRLVFGLPELARRIESATMPAPACTTTRIPADQAQRIAMAVSRFAAPQPT